MNMKIFAAAALALVAVTGAASAKTQAGAGLFDQGGDYYNRSVETAPVRNIDRTPTASIKTHKVTVDQKKYSAVPADNLRNEPGLGLFDRTGQ